MYDHQRTISSTETSSTSRQLPAPGKSTLTASLPPRFAAHAGALLGHDFGNVGIHQDGQAEALGTRAFARGDEIHVAAGAYDPASEAGLSLLGHELGHVAQQREGRVAATGTAGGMAANRDAGLEAEADAAGERVVQGFDLDAFLDFGRPRAAGVAASPVVQGEDLPAEEPEMFHGVPVRRSMCEVCAPRGPSAANTWGLPEPLLVRMGADLPLVDVTAGTTSIALATPFGSAKLGSDGAFKLGIKDGNLNASTDGTKVEAGGKLGPVSGTVDSEGKIAGEATFGPFKLGADSSGKVSATVHGVKLTYDGATGDVAVAFTPELSWGPAKVKAAPVANGVKLTLELKLELAKDWSLTIAQDYVLQRTITTDEASRAIVETVVDPFFRSVNGDAGTFSDLLEALDTTR